MDTFNEQIVQKKKTAGEYAIIVATVVGLLVLVAVMLVIPLVMILVAAAGFGAYYLITAQNKEFEYSVTNGDIDIDTIIGRRKRKRIVSVTGKKVERLLPFENGRFREADYQRVVMAAPSMNEPELWYFTYHSKKNGHTAVVFQPDNRVLSALYSGLQTTVRLETDRALREKGITVEKNRSSHGIG